MAPKRGRGGAAPSTSSRAADLLAKARAAAAQTPAGTAAVEAAVKRKTQDEAANAIGNPSPVKLDISAEPVPLNQLIKQLANHGFTMHEALPIAGKLIKGGFAIPAKLKLLSSGALEELGVESPEARQKVAAAFAGRRTAMMLQSAQGGKDSGRKKRRYDDDAILSREYGNVAGPSTSKSSSTPANFFFHEILDESSLSGRYAYVNRAPVMTAWTTIVLERLGFNRAEALSVAHCYVSHTSTSRGVSLGIIPASERDRIINAVGPNQPHFELMGIKIPVMQTEGGQWRGISGGEVIPPERSFNYLRKSMFQTLPVVMGALTLLADSYVQPSKDEDESEAASDSSSGDILHAQAYSLYTTFRPETGGQWGKRARFEMDKILALRQGHEADWTAWLKKEEESELLKSEGSIDEGAGNIDEEEARLLEEEIARMAEAGSEAEATNAVEGNVKQEVHTGGTIKGEPSNVDAVVKPEPGD